MAALSQLGNLPPSPPSSTRGGGRDSWDFAVPLHSENRTDDRKRISNDTAPYRHTSTARQPLLPQTNGTSKPTILRGDTADSLTSYRSSQEAPPSRLQPVRPEFAQRKLSDISTATSDPDSLLELYNNSRNVSYAFNGDLWPDRDSMARTQAMGRNGVPEDVDDNWIHRDKLAQIESRELEEAGLKMRGRASRSRSGSAGLRSGSSSRTRRKESSADGHSSDVNGEDRFGVVDRRQRMISPKPADVEAEEEPFNPEIRTRAEIAADEEATSSPTSRTHHLRPSTSRIPIARNSPAPVPNTYVERDAPLPRSRNGSGAWGGLEDSIGLSRARERSASVGSQVLLDDLEYDHRPVTPGTNPSSPNSSPPKRTTVPAKGGPVSKKQNQRVQSKSRTTSATHRDSPNKRPTTSSGRPSTSHARPEGEAPWIATMYKPDPMLPPDQQMLPTHAKRLAREQWEREGKTGSVYDKDFNVLVTDDFVHLKSGHAPHAGEEGQDPAILSSIAQPDQRDSQQWPLASPKPDITGPEHGGYSTIPRITSQTMTSPHLRSAHNSQALGQPNTITATIQRIPDVSEKESKKKGCGCCIVM